MIIATTPIIEGRKIQTTLGVVSGSTVRAKNIGRDIIAALKNIVGGELSEYTQLLGQSREHAVQRMTEKAETMGANAIVNMRFMTSLITGGAAEILAYGTAVILAEDK